MPSLCPRIVLLKRDTGHPSSRFMGIRLGPFRVELRCGGRSYDERASIQPGSELTLDLVGLSVGQHRCSGSLELQTPDGAQAQMPLNLSVGLLPPLALTVAAEDLDLDNLFHPARSGQSSIAACSGGGHRARWFGDWHR